MKKITKQNWYLDLIHLALQYCVAWFFVYSFLYFGAKYDYQHINIKFIFMCFVFICILILYFWIYKKYELKVPLLLLTGFIFLSLTLISYFPQAMIVGNVNSWPIFKKSLEFVFSLLCVVPLSFYIFSFFSKKFFYGLMVISLIGALYPIVFTFLTFLF